jgi:hypothetical protein
VLDSQIKALVEAVRSELRAIQEAVQEQTAAANQAKEASSEQWRQIPRIISTVIQAKDSARAERSQQEENERKKEQQPLIDSQERIAKWTKRACIAAIGYGAVALWQGFTLSRQLEQMRRATEANVRAVQLAEESFELSDGDFNRTMRQMIHQTASQASSAKATQDAAKSMERSAAAGKETADASQAAVQATKDAIYLEERPWVGVVPTMSQCSGRPAQPCQELVPMVVNSGKTPALHLKVTCFDSIATEPAPKTCGEISARRDNEMIHTLTQYELRSHPGEDPAAAQSIVADHVRRNSEMAKAFLVSEEGEGTTILPGAGGAPLPRLENAQPHAITGPAVNQYLLGAFTYHDPLRPKVEHTTQFCLWRHGGSDWQICRYGQDMN